MARSTRKELMVDGRSSIRVFNSESPAGFRAAQLSDLTPNGGSGVTWIDLLSPNAELVRDLGSQFGFHPLALEDALKRGQRPKVDVYEDHLFFVIHALDPTVVDHDITAHEIAIFVTDQVVVTVHFEAITVLEIAERRWVAHRRDDASTGMLVYTIVDSVVDDYFPCMDRLADEIDAIEARMFTTPGRRDLEAIFSLKRSLLEVRRLVAPGRDVFNVFIRRETTVAMLGDESLVYFQDIYDHVIRITETIDLYRDILSSAVDVYLSLQSNIMNQTVRTLTAASIVLMSMALIASVYGMNFDDMPELGWRIGYYLALTLMLTIGLTLAWIFRRLHWW